MADDTGEHGTALSGARETAEPPASTADLEDWNRIAQRYAQVAGTPDDRIYQQLKDALWESLGDVRGMNVLDLGCGHGWLSQALADAGARVVGVDGSAELLRMARASHPGIRFIEHDLAGGLPLMRRAFDRVVAHMVLMDIPEIDRLLRAVRGALRPNGRLVFTLPHPCFFNQKTRRDERTGKVYCAVTGYLRPAVWRIESFGGHSHYHRSLTYYFERLRASRFAVTRLYEPPQRPGPDAVDVEFQQQIAKFVLIEAEPLPWRTLALSEVYPLRDRGQLMAHIEPEQPLGRMFGPVDLVIGKERIRMRCDGVGHICGRSSGCTLCASLVPDDDRYPTVRDIMAFLGQTGEPDLYRAPGMYLERIEVDG